jgi:hypothetical protein
MPFDKFEDMGEITDDRHKAVAKSIRVIEVQEIKKLTDEIFHFADDPWRDTVLQLVAENPGATFYHADAGEGVVFLYLRDQDKGLWWLPHSGMGPLSARGRQAMKDAIDQGR